MRTPISYYGGKQTMLKHILPLIPRHRIYTEAFCGGAAVLFAKRPAEAEVIKAEEEAEREEEIVVDEVVAVDGDTLVVEDSVTEEPAQA